MKIDVKLMFCYFFALDPSWDGIGRSWLLLVALGPSGDGLGRSWAVLGRSWAELRHFGSRPKNGQETKNRCFSIVLQTFREHHMFCKKHALRALLVSKRVPLERPKSGPRAP